MQSKTAKTATPFKQIFEPAKVHAAQAVMQPTETKQPNSLSRAARNRKAGGRGVRISGYLPVEISEALRDEVIRRTISERQTVSFNDVLCSILTDWHRNNQKSAA
jgi:hypothetical protein